jgi:YegS/Rv2252/BmrU family lipid kinase
MSDVIRAVFFANKGSRRTTDLFTDAERQLKAKGIEVVQSQLFESTHLLLSAIQSSNAPVVILGGGDGTINSAAHFFENGERTLAIMPFGTGNAFARDLGIPSDVSAAAQIISEFATTEIDLGTANSRRFLNVATLGLTTLIAAELSTGIKRVSATAAYLLALIRALSAVKPFEAKLQIAGGETHDFKTLQVVIGNGRFHAGPFLVSENASLRAGKLFGYALKSTSKGSLIRLALKLRRGDQGDLRDVLTFEFEKAHLDTHPSRGVTLDGEQLTQSPVDFRVRPKALRVVVPSNWDDRAETPP